ncbi:hypothetical protein [Egicoccus sp. AB-alg2]|uniref:hypothetical protein n=1 Tax=Egicoccus sp. AB-alg2 TaxID=3242693 RepID=UPI00359F1278
MSSSEAGGDRRPAGGDADPQRQLLEVEVVRLQRRVQELEAQPPSTGQRVRDIATWILVVFTVLAIALTSVAIWLRSTVFDTNRFMDAVQPGLTSLQVAEAVSTRLTTETVQALDLENRLDQALTELGDTLSTNLGGALGLTAQQQQRVQSLPLPQLEQLAGPIASGIEGRIDQLIDRIVQTPEFENLLVDLTRNAHLRAVALVRGDYSQLPNVEVASGEVRLNLVPAVAQVLTQLADQGLQAAGFDGARIPDIAANVDPETAVQRLGEALGVDLPSDFGQVPLMSQDDLAQLQAAARAADQLVWLGVVVTLALVAGTVVLSRHRRRTVLYLGLGTAIATVLTMLLLRNLQGTVAGQAATPEGQAAVGTLTDSVLDSLRTTMLLVLVVALLVAFAAHLASRPAWARRTYEVIRTSTASRPGGSDVEGFVARYDTAFRLGAIALGILVLALVGITLLSVVVVVPLVLLALWGIAVAEGRAGSPAAAMTTSRVTSRGGQERPRGDAPAAPGAAATPGTNSGVPPGGHDGGRR